MKKIIFLLIVALFTTKFSNAEEFNHLNSIKELGYSYKVVDESNCSKIIEITDGKISWFHVIAAITTTVLPETAQAICVKTVGDPKICNVVYDVTAALVALRGEKIYENVTQGMYWLASRGKYRSKAVVKTKTYKTAQAVKVVFDTYKSIGCIKWNDISTNETNNYGKVSSSSTDCISFTTLQMKGFIDAKYSIEMLLSKTNKNQLVGHYFYKRQRKNIEIKGTIDGNKIKLTTYNPENGDIEYFSGILDKDGNFSGLWNAPDIGKEHLFAVSQK